MTAMERIRRIIGGGKTMDTLGGRSRFTVELHDSRLIVTTSSGYEYIVSEDIVEKVARQFDSLPFGHKYMASHYVKPRWPDCPSNRVSPYVARILKEGESLIT